jgi:hypothetical protein
VHILGVTTNPQPTLGDPGGTHPRCRCTARSSDDAARIVGSASCGPSPSTLATPDATIPRPGRRIRSHIRQLT